VQRILIIRFSSIGDIVLTSPVIRALRQKFPQADIRFLTKRTYAELVEPNPYLNGVFYLDQDIQAVIRQVKAFGPECIIDLHNNLRTSLVKAANGAKSYSFSKLNLEKWLRVNTHIDLLPDVHIVDRYLEAATSLGIVNDGQGLDFFIPEKVVMPALEREITGDYVVIVVGAKFNTKQVPTLKLRQILDGINAPIILIGGVDDAERGRQLANRPSIMNACGKLSLLESARILQNARVVITPDTGMMHIAAAFGRPIISIWGNTIPKFGMAPYMPQHPEHSVIMEQKGLRCRPCSKIGFSACPKGHFNCMNLLDVNTIISTTNQFLNE